MNLDLSFYLREAAEDYVLPRWALLVLDGKRSTKTRITYRTVTFRTRAEMRAFAREHRAAA